jgi:hypothetical protein
MKTTRFFAAAALLLMAFQVNANPPSADSADAVRMKDYAGLVRGMKQPGGEVSCCSLADCRPVDNWRINRDGHYEVFIRKLTPDGHGWTNGPDAYVEVPDEKVIHGSAVPEPVACWTHHPENKGFYCFTPGSGT